MYRATLLTPFTFDPSWAVTATAMSSEVACDFSITDLFHMLDEKLNLECTRLRKAPLPSVVSAGLLELVSVPEPHPLNGRGGRI